MASHLPSINECHRHRRRGILHVDAWRERSKPRSHPAGYDHDVRAQAAAIEPRATALAQPCRGAYRSDATNARTAVQ